MCLSAAAQTLDVFMDYSAGCLRDEVIRVRVEHGVQC